MTRSASVAALAVALLLSSAQIAIADDLFNGADWAGVARDRRASQPGDVITVIVYQAAEARNAAQNTSRTSRSFDGSIEGGNLSESGELSLSSAYGGQGEVRRSESFVTRFSVVVREVLPNGDLYVAGDQLMDVNGEETQVRVEGRVRPADIGGDNQILSTRIADARISYDGKGFVSRNARPNIIHRALALLGLGG